MSPQKTQILLLKNPKGKRGWLENLHKLQEVQRGAFDKPQNLGFGAESKCKGSLDKCRNLCKCPKTQLQLLLMWPRRYKEQELLAPGFFFWLDCCVDNCFLRSKLIVAVTLIVATFEKEWLEGFDRQLGQGRAAIREVVL